MKKAPEFEIIISTCEKFSDLWDANIKLLKESWSDCRAKVHLVTDSPTDRRFDGVEITCAGEGTEITQRLRRALEKVEAPYVLFTLDDYFYVTPIDSRKINRILCFMDDNEVDYTRLYPATKHYLKREGAVECEEYKGFFFRNIEEGDYKISLAPGMWRTDFMRKTTSDTLNAWQYEIALTQMARDLNAKCAISNHNELPYLDVIRKGKLLRKADRYFKKNPIYQSDRDVMKLRDEISLSARTKLRHILPKKSFNKLKKFMIKRGRTYYSSPQE